MSLQTKGRSIQCLIRQATPRCKYASSKGPVVSRQFSLSRTQQVEQDETDKEERPKWSYTPERMKAPYPWRPPGKPWECNSDPARLDEFYIRFLGSDGDKMLTEEIKWLAITHKSFDQGRRGFNDRLAFFGRRILNIQTNLTLVNSPPAGEAQPLRGILDDRKPFIHPALQGLSNLNVPLGDILTKGRFAALATKLGMQEIVRWKPRYVDSLSKSGIDVVLTAGIYGIIGAIALQKGGDVAAKVARERVLAEFGIS